MGGAKQGIATVAADERLRDLTGRVRLFLEPRWTVWMRRQGCPKLVTPSQGTCGRSSLFLSRVLQDNGFPADFAAGNPAEGRKGFLTQEGWKGHAWVECGGLILDVTADQFGLPPVLITGVDDPRFGRGRDTTAPEFISRRQHMVEELLADWAQQ